MPISEEQEKRNLKIIINIPSTEDPDAQHRFRELYEEYKGLMYSVAFTILENHSDAEDVVHEAFITIFKNFEKISQVKCPQTKAYIVIITRSRAIDFYRKRENHISIPENYASPEQDPLSDILDLSQESELVQAFGKIPSNYRDILLLHYYNGFSTKELSEILGIKRNSVNRLISRAKLALAQQLQSEDNL